MQIFFEEDSVEFLLEFCDYSFPFQTLLSRFVAAERLQYFEKLALSYKECSPKTTLGPVLAWSKGVSLGQIGKGKHFWTQRCPCPKKSPKFNVQLRVIVGICWMKVISASAMW